MRPDRSSEGASGRIAVFIIYVARSEDAAPIAPNHFESHRLFLRYPESLLLEPVTQDMLSSQMHRFRTPSRMDTPSHRQSQTNESKTEFRCLVSGTEAKRSQVGQLETVLRW